MRTQFKTRSDPRPDEASLADLDELLRSIEADVDINVDALNEMLAKIDPADPLGRIMAKTMVDLAGLTPGELLGCPGELRVNVTDDGLTASVEIIPPLGNAPPLDWETAVGRLRDMHGIIALVDEGALRRLVEEGARSVTHGVIARGEPAVQPEAEKWEAAEKPETPSLNFEPGSIDYREYGVLTAIESGQLLARRVPAIDGRRGRDVFGKIIEPGEAITHPELKAGAGTVVMADGIYATMAGELQRDGDLLSVLPVRRIVGDVDFSTGNISFPGAVIILGSILDRFVVQCSGSLEVSGSIHGATVTAGGSIRVRGGIIGRDEARIRAEGDIEAKFIEHAHIETKGNLIVSRGILYSEIYVMGRIEVLGKPGTVIGGVIASGEGLHCRILGSVADTQTRVYFGENYLDRRRWIKIDETIEIQKKRIVEIDHALARSALEWQPELRKRLADMRAHALVALQKLLAARVACLVHLKNGSDGEVRISGEIFAGVALASRGFEHRIDRPGVRARYRLRGDQIALVSYD